MKSKILYRESKWLYLAYLISIAIAYFLGDKELLGGLLLIFLCLIITLNESKPKKDAFVSPNTKEEKAE